MHLPHARELHVSEPVAEIVKPQLVVDEFHVRPIRPVALVVPEVVDCLCHGPMIRFEPYHSAGQQEAGGDDVPGAVAWTVPEGAFLVGVRGVFVLQQCEREDVISDLWGESAEEWRLRLGVACGEVFGRGTGFDAQLFGRLGFDFVDFWDVGSVMGVGFWGDDVVCGQHW